MAPNKAGKSIDEDNHNEVSRDDKIKYLISDDDLLGADVEDDAHVIDAGLPKADDDDDTKRIQDLTRALKQANLDKFGASKFGASKFGASVWKNQNDYSPSNRAELGRPRATFDDGPPIVLSLDGAGDLEPAIQLDLLNSLMQAISRDVGETDIKPCEVFHLIVGSGSGGLVAILLGRLRMSVQEATEWYRSLEDKVIFPLARAMLTEVDPDLAETKRETAARLKQMVTELVEQRGLGSELMEDAIRPLPLTKVLIPVVEQLGEHNFQTRMLWGYDRKTELPARVDSDFPKDINLECSIVDAVAAVMAHPPFFDPIRVEDAKGLLVGSPMKYVNPINLAIKATEALFFEPRMASSEKLFISIGASIAEGDMDEAESAEKADDAEQEEEGAEGQPLEQGFLEKSKAQHARLCAKIEIQREEDENRHQSLLRSFNARIGCKIDEQPRCFRLNRTPDGTPEYWRGVVEAAASAIERLRLYCIGTEQAEYQRQSDEHAMAMIKGVMKRIKYTVDSNQ